jgi:hypothetical protein
MHRLRYVGSEQTGSDTAFQYQLAVVTVNPDSADMDYNFENGTCSKMTIRDLGVSVCEWCKWLFLAMNLLGCAVTTWTSDVCSTGHASSDQSCVFVLQTTMSRSSQSHSTGE